MLGPGSPRAASSAGRRRALQVLVAVGGAACLALAVASRPVRSRTALVGAPPPSASSATETNPCILRADGAAVMGGCDVVAYAHLANESADGRAAPNCTLGDAALAASYDGFTFLFSSEANKATFAADPEAHIPAYGGFCAYGTCCEDWWTPSDMEADVNPNVWVIVDGRLLSFRGHEPLAAFMEDKEANVAAADARWAGWVATYGETVFNTRCVHYGYR